MAKKQKIFWAILIGGLFLLCLIPRVLLALGIPLPRLGPAPHQALECRNRLTGESIAIPLEPIDIDYAGGQNTYFTTDLSLGQMVEQMEALDEPPFDQVVQAGSSEAWVRSGRSLKQGATGILRIFPQKSTAGALSSSPSPSIWPVGTCGCACRIWRSPSERNGQANRLPGIP